ncbi:alpha/beta hydrolase [Streptomyces sp. AK02-01A]|uniref:alpha/beta fold hydrolase n=1 Tax=Streptomyces sp. AK02-01A TaxID=3028648 RepID=UPI0029A9080E|nr:alpha/beta hydrolase [Streptomyces sp. AK02-01A]MDX3851411.1 alpha/beta hydrolase [Streptomyces sp. AK02-01A]
MTGEKRSSVTTNDGVRIAYTEAGDGAPLVLIPGIAQSAAEFRKQTDDLSQDHRVIAMDPRGHGESGKPDHGYRVSRLAADLRDLIEALDLRNITLLGHSLGCTVIWCYWDLFGGDRVSRLVLVDQAAVVAADRVPEDQAAELGAIFTADMALGIAASLRGADGADFWRALVDTMHTPSLSAADADWIVQQNARLPLEHTATLHLDHYGNDWRDVLPRITVPTLVIGGAVSIFAPSVARRTASLIPGAEVRVFSEAEAGSHLMFWENAELFNAVVRDFVSRTDSPGAGPAS